MRQRALVALVGAMALITPILGGAGAKAQRVEACNLGFQLPRCSSIPFDAGIDPSLLPADHGAPVRVILGGRLDAPVFQLPRVSEITVDFGRAGSVDPSGFGDCRRNEIETVGSGTARAICRSAILGFGSAQVVTRSAEETPVPVELTLFKGVRTSEGEHVLIHGFILPPVNEPIVAVATLTPVDEGQFGLRATVPMPSILGGSAALKSFHLRTITRRGGKGRMYGFARARCPVPDGFTHANTVTAQMRIFTEGSSEPVLSSPPAVRPCSIDTRRAATAR